MKYEVFDYIKLLEISLKYINDYELKYNSEMENITYKRELEYHIFTFTQIVYAIQERLKYDFHETWSRTKDLFEKDINEPKSELGVVVKIANKFKHEDSLDLIQYYYDLKLFPDGIVRPTKVSKVIKSKYNLHHRDKTLNQIFSNAYNTIKEYCEELKDD